MQKLKSILFASPSRNLLLVRYGIHETKSFGEIFNGITAFARSWAHNPFDANDQFNKKLHDRELEFLATNYRKGYRGLQLSSLHSNTATQSFGKDNFSRYLKAIQQAMDLLSKEDNNVPYSNKSFGILAEVFSKNKTNFLSISDINLYFENTKKILNEQFTSIKKSLNEDDIQILAANLVREIINDINQQKETKFSLENINNRILEKAKFKANQLFPKSPDLATKTHEFQTMLKKEFLYLFGLFIFEAFLSVFSPNLVFSFTQTPGMIAFAFSRFIITSTFSYSIPFLENTWCQLASFGDKDGPKTLDDIITNIRIAMQKSWKNAVNSEKSFHPLVDAFLNTAFVMSTWCPLASYQIKSHAIYYLFLDGYLSLRSSFLSNKNRRSISKDFIIACSGGIVRGLIKNLQKTTAFSLAFGPNTYTIGRGFYDMLITYVCVILGHIFRVILTQILNLRELKTKTD